MNQDAYVVIEHLRGQVSDISYVMLAAARVLAHETNGNVVAILLGQNSQDLASDLLADQVIYVEHPVLVDFTSDAYAITLEHIIREKAPRIVLFGNTSIGSGIASLLSTRLMKPLVNSCIKFDTSNDELKIVSQICGGKIMVESKLPDETLIVTMIPGIYKPEDGKSDEMPGISTISAPILDDMKVNLTQFIEPEVEDVDITNEQILISVGRGIQTEDNIELAEELAELLDGVVCASRPIVDQGWLPISRMVGKSGKKVKAKLYLALGISGAPEHIEGITDCETIIAVNTDPTAPIFETAKYGAEIDLLDLSEILIEQIEELRGD